MATVGVKGLRIDQQKKYSKIVAGMNSGQIFKPKITHKLD